MSSVGYYFIFVSDLVLYLVYIKFILIISILLIAQSLIYNYNSIDYCLNLYAFTYIIHMFVSTHARVNIDAYIDICTCINAHIYFYKRVQINTCSRLPVFYY